uniref:B3 domain-containing protein n=1 Tax=Aegilops tauschii TaxID=37682 RepID=N1R3W8_AEGTA
MHPVAVEISSYEELLANRYTPNHVLQTILEYPLGVLIVAYLRGIRAANIENQVANYQLDQDNLVPTPLDIYHSILEALVDQRCLLHFCLQSSPLCLECVDRHYWHMKDHDWCFVKVMSLSNFKDEMAIPDEFTTNFRGHISDKVKLEVADGNIYNVQVAKEQDKFILRSGWVDFTAQDVTSSKYIPEPRSSGGLPGSTESRYILEKGCILTSAQKARVDTFVKESWTGIQFYVTVMNEKSLSDGCLVICKDFAAKHLPHKDQTIKLCYPQNSKTWDANLAVITDGACTRSCILAAGWLDFVRDNNLREGDICAFEVSKDHDRVIITVHLLKNVVVTGHTKSTSQQQKKWTHPGYVVTKYTKLTCKQKRKIEERIQAIRPETRIFVSIIYSSRAKLSIEVRYATAHLPREEQWVRLQLPGKNHTWKAKLYIGDKDKGKCYALQTGWKKFVDDNKLQDDDMCLFELLKNEELTMNVHIIRGD